MSGFPDEDQLFVSGWAVRRTLRNVCSGGVPTDFRSGSAPCCNVRLFDVRAGHVA